MLTSMKEQYHKLTLNPPNWIYYPEMWNNPKFEELLDFYNDSALDFIKDYYACGGKIDAWYKTDIEHEIKMTPYRASHTISAYLLGIVLKKKLNLSMDNLPKLHNDCERNFLYFWYLACLYHDIAHGIEKYSQKLCPYKTLDKFNQHFDINKYNFLKETKESKFYKDYYQYRLEEWKCIDHGIAGALLFYDGLVRLYHTGRIMEHKKVNESFTHQGLYYSEEHLDFCLKVAETIASHNLWRAELSNIEECKKYEKYGLEKLIPKKSPSDDHIVYCEDDAFLFLLGMVDTMEPLKYFANNNVKNRNQIPPVLDDFLDSNDSLNRIADKNIENNPYEILNNVHLAFSDNAMVLKCQLKNYEEYYRNIKDMEKWLGVDVSNNHDNSLTIRIIHKDVISKNVLHCQWLQ